MRGIIFFYSLLVLLLIGTTLWAAPSEIGLDCYSINQPVDTTATIDSVLKVIAYDENPFVSQLEKFVLDYPSETLSELRYPQRLSEKAFLLALLTKHPELGEGLLSNYQAARNFLKNHPDQVEQVFDVLAEYYTGVDLINITTQFWKDVVENNSNRALSKSFRATREGYVGGDKVGASILYAMGETAWVQEGGYDPELLEEYDHVLLANIGVNPKLMSFENESGNLTSDVSLVAAVDLEFLTNGAVYPTAHFDGIFGLETGVQYFLTPQDLLQFRVQALHQSTHAVDSIIKEDLKGSVQEVNGQHIGRVTVDKLLSGVFHIDSAEWVSAEVSYQRLDQPIEKEVYVSAGKYFHSMAQHPLVYRGEIGAVLSALDRRLALSGAVDVLRVGVSSEPQSVGEIEGTHFGGRVKLFVNPNVQLGNIEILDDIRFVGAYDFGLDTMGQNIPYKNNRILLGIQVEK